MAVLDSIISSGAGVMEGVSSTHSARWKRISTTAPPAFRKWHFFLMGATTM